MEKHATLELNSEDLGTIEKLLESIQEAKSSGGWRNTRVNVFDVLGRPRQEDEHFSFLAGGMGGSEC